MSDPSLNDLPKVHPRGAVVQRAENEFNAFVLDWHARHGLTLSEQLMIQSQSMTSTLAGCVRAERRRGEDESPGGTRD